MIEPGTLDALHDVWGSGLDDVFAVGDAATLLHCAGRCDESARPWPRIAVPVPPDTVLHAVRGVGQSVFVTGDRGTVVQLIRSPVR